MPALGIDIIYSAKLFRSSRIRMRIADWGTMRKSSFSILTSIDALFTKRAMSPTSAWVGIYFTLLLSLEDQGSSILSSGLPKGIPGPTSTTTPLRTSCFSTTLGGRYRPALDFFSPLSGRINTLSPTTSICLFLLLMVEIRGVQTVESRIMKQLEFV